MSKYKFAMYDAFASKPFEGNPCPVFFNTDELSDQEMLSITKEMNQSECAFISASKVGHLKFKFFTPQKEIPLAGHPTIAAVTAALDEGLLERGSSSFQIELRDGPIQVGIDVKNNSFLIHMYQRAPIFYDTHNPDVVMPIFGLKKEDLYEGACIQTVSTGTRQLMVLLRSQEVLRRLSLREQDYIKYKNEKNFFSSHLFCLEGISADAQTFARHPGVYPDLVEDAFTGSATGAMAAFLWKYKYIDQPAFVAEQGHWMGRPGRAYVRVVGAPDKIETVIVSGQAVRVAEGIFHL